MGRILGMAARGLAIAIATVVVLAFALLLEPQWLLNGTTVGWAVKKFAASYRPRWTAFDFRIRSASLADKELELSARDLCFDAEGGAARGCFPEIDVALSIRLSFKQKVALTRLSRLVVRERSFVLDRRRLTAAPAARTTKKPGSAELASLVPEAARALRIEALDVELPSLVVIESDTQSVRASAEASFSPGRTLPLRVEAEARMPGAPARRLRARLDLGSDYFSGEPLSYLRARARVYGPGPLNVALDARADQRGPGRIGFSGEVTASSGTLAARARLSGSRSAQSYEAASDVVVRQSSGPLRELRLSPCRARLPRTTAGAVTGVSLDCSARASLGELGVSLSSFPKTLEGVIRGFARIEQDPAGRFSGAATVGLGPPADWYRAHASLSTRFKGRLSDLPGSLELDHSLTATLDAEFEGLVKALRGTRWSVPAPLNALKGPLTLTARSIGSPLASEQTLAYRLTARLAAPPQAFEAVVDGRLRARDAFGPGRALEDETAVSLEKVAITLPYLKVGPPPMVAKDSRIYPGPPPRGGPAAAPAVSTAAPALPLAWKARVSTVKPVQLLSNLAEDPIPISLALSAAPAGLSGRVAVERFRARLFKQSAVIDHVTLTPRPGGAETGLDGLILYKTADATIHILLAGSTAKPQVILQSVPPMTQQEIVALLLYGKTPDALDSGQAQSVGNAQSALASGAFGLASLYLFASTPIDYVGYDPSSQTYSIKFKLPGGASLSVGSTLDESQSLSLRKRLASHWVLETVARRSSSEGNVVETILEWFERY